MAKPAEFTGKEARKLEEFFSRKVGRNEPCPCGSGKKYKKCCGGVGEGPHHPAPNGPIGGIYELRVTLKNVRPPIWRTFTVPDTIKLSTLHNVLQTVMGWTDSHLHLFRSGKRRLPCFPPVLPFSVVKG